MNTNDRIVHMCSAIGGASMREVMDSMSIEMGNAAWRLQMLQKQGYIIKARPPVKGAKFRYHATGKARPLPGVKAANGRQAVRDDKPAGEPSMNKRGRPPGSKSNKYEPHTRPAKEQRTGEPIITAATKYTFQAAPVDSRFQVAPGERVPPIFRGVPGLDPLTGRPWA